MSCRSVLSVFIVLLVIALPCAGQDSWNIEPVDSILVHFEDVDEIFVVGDFAYTWSSPLSSIVVFDISDLENPYLAYAYYFESCTFFKAFNSIAFFKDYPDLIVLDISQPDDVHILSTIQLENGFSLYDFQDPIIYLTTRETDIISYDLTDPQNPSHIGSISTDYSPGMILVQDDYAYCNENASNNLLVYDVSDPTDISFISCTEMDRYSPLKAVNNDYLFIATGDENRDNRIGIMDASNPQNLLFISRTAEFRTGIGHTEVSGDYLYLTTMENLHIVDISDIDDPNLINTHYTGGFRPEFDIIDNYYLIASSNYYTATLNIVDLQNPEQPQVIGIWETSPVYSIAFQDSTVFCIGESIIRRYSLDNSISPKTTMVFGDVNDIAICDDYAFIANAGLGITSIDISDPENQVVLDNLNYGGMSRRIICEDTIAYLANSPGGFAIINISDPTSALSRNSIIRY